jgi:hypothetical protein
LSPVAEEGQKALRADCRPPLATHLHYGLNAPPTASIALFHFRLSQPSAVAVNH